MNWLWRTIADTGAALSDALVNMRYAFSRAVAEGVIQPRDAPRPDPGREEPSIFPNGHTMERSAWPRNLVPAGELNRLRLWLQHRCPDLKADDALRLLRAANRLSKGWRANAVSEPRERSGAEGAPALDNSSGALSDAEGRE